MTICKKSTHVVYEKSTGKYFFIYPGGLQDAEIKNVDLVESLDWEYIYKELYRYKLKYNIENFSGDLLENLSTYLGIEV